MSWMNYFIFLIVISVVVGIFIFYLKSNKNTSSEISLPAPSFDGTLSVEKAIKNRRSTRSYKKDTLTIAQVSQLLWAAQGITSKDGFRTAPSAGATYPLEIYLIVGDVTGITSGIYKYNCVNHSLRQVCEGDKREDLCQAVLNQEWIKHTSVAIAVCGVYERTVKKYGKNATKYVHMEVGCVAQNVYLQAQSLGLGTVFVGACDESKMSSLLNLSNDETPLCVLPVGIINQILSI
jgi:SagB-type dehydrogenase family enzyme